MDNFTLGYIECALWSSSAGIKIADDGTVTEDQDSDTSFDSHGFDVDDIAPDSLVRILADCADFQDSNGRLLAIASQQGGRDDSSHGHDFWLTRNRHGAGFWDRGYRFGIGEALTEAAHAYGSSDLFYADGKIHAA